MIDLNVTFDVMQRVFFDLLNVAYDVVINPGPNHWPDCDDAPKILRSFCDVGDYRVIYTLYIDDDVGSAMLITGRIEDAK